MQIWLMCDVSYMSMTGDLILCKALVSRCTQNLHFQWCLNSFQWAKSIDLPNLKCIKSAFSSLTPQPKKTLLFQKYLFSSFTLKLFARKRWYTIHKTLLTGSEKIFNQSQLYNITLVTNQHNLQKKKKKSAIHHRK